MTNIIITNIILKYYCVKLKFIDRVRDYEVYDFKYKQYIILGLTYIKWPQVLLLSERKYVVYT